MKSFSKRHGSSNYDKKNDSSGISGMTMSQDGIREADIKHINTNDSMRTETQTSFNQDFVTPHNGRLVQSFGNDDCGDTFYGSRSKLYSKIVPYKRKGSRETSDVNASHWSISDTASANHSSFHSSANHIIPYKRKRTETISTTPLIQTPLLYDEKFKPNK